MIINFLKDAWEGFLDFIYPRNIYCIVCNRVIDKTRDYSICADCRLKLKEIEGKICLQCGKPLDDYYYPDYCPDCTQNRHYFTRGWSCVEYEEIARQLMHELKYNQKSYVPFHMAEMMAEKFRKINLEIDVLVYVPLHPKSEMMRGYNQSRLIADFMAKKMNKPIAQGALKKVKETMDQNQLSRKERRKNLSAAFKVFQMDFLEGKNILLIDDVYTTGSTVDACSKELLKAKPKNIYVMTFATGKNI